MKESATRRPAEGESGRSRIHPKCSIANNENVKSELRVAESQFAMVVSTERRSSCRPLGVVQAAAAPHCNLNEAKENMKQAKINDKHVRARRADNRDAEVGRRVRSRRLECRLSQTELADRIGVTFQQVQKYEKGVNRIGAGRCNASPKRSKFRSRSSSAAPEAPRRAKPAPLRKAFSASCRPPARCASSRRSTRSRAARHGSFWSRWPKNWPTRRAPNPHKTGGVPPADVAAQIVFFVFLLA